MERRDRSSTYVQHTTGTVDMSRSLCLCERTAPAGFLQVLPGWKSDALHSERVLSTGFNWVNHSAAC
eukprot:12907375-Alexandrium_andersonii.AAC.1